MKGGALEVQKTLEYLQMSLLRCKRVRAGLKMPRQDPHSYPAGILLPLCHLPSLGLTVPSEKDDVLT